jgi:2-amino-4-hydroxy-6-hydroxymethyldihydropteridine diphosphokinase
MNRAYLITGGNLGDRTANLAAALRRIAAEAGTIVASSAIYETEAWGKTNQPAFLNQAVIVDTSLAPQALLDLLLHIEKEIGRVRYQKWDARLIDIDIIFIDQLVQQDPVLTLPHPFFQDRRFALTPMAEIAGDFVHPVFHQTVDALLEACPDPLAARKLD